MNSQQVDGSRLRELRKLKGMTLKQLADGICSISYLSNIETGKSTPTPDMLQALADRLGISFEGLVQDEPNDKVIVEKTPVEPNETDQKPLSLEAIAKFVSEMNLPEIKPGLNYLSRNERNRYLFLNGMVHKGHEITEELKVNNADPKLILIFDVGIQLIAKGMAARMKQLDPESFKKLNRETYMLDIALVHRSDASVHYKRFYEQDRRMREIANEELGGDPVSTMAEIVLLKVCKGCDGSPRPKCAAYEAMEALKIPEWDDSHPRCKYAGAGVL